MSTEFEPVLYLKESCPSCFKVRLFLLDAGLIGGFELREFTPGDEREQAIRDELAPHFEKTTFPTVQYAPGKYMRESDDIIALYKNERNVDVASLRLFNIYGEILLPRLRRLNRENKELKQQLEACASAIPA